MKRKMHIGLGGIAMISVFAGWATGCVPEGQGSVTDALASSADAAITSLLSFAVDFGRQALAAFLF